MLSIACQPPKALRWFKACALGYVHIDIAEVWTEQGRLYLFLAIDRVTKFAFAELHQRATRPGRCEVPSSARRACPLCRPHGLTDNGFQFTAPHGSWSVREIRQLPAAGQCFRAHAFDSACAQLGIVHRLTKFNHS